MNTAIEFVYIIRLLLQKSVTLQKKDSECNDIT